MYALVVQAVTSTLSTILSVVGSILGFMGTTPCVIHNLFFWVLCVCFLYICLVFVYVYKNDSTLPEGQHE